MIFEEDKIQMNTKFSETAYRWDAFLKWDETTSLYVLYITSKTALLIPKRVFENAQQEADFVQLIKRKITDLKNPTILDA